MILKGKENAYSTCKEYLHIKRVATLVIIKNNRFTLLFFFLTLCILQAKPSTKDIRYQEEFPGLKDVSICRMAGLKSLVTSTIFSLFINRQNGLQNLAVRIYKIVEKNLMSVLSHLRKSVRKEKTDLVSLVSEDDSYRKNSKIWDTSNNCHNCPKNRKV